MIIDVNVHTSRWPTRRLPCDEPVRLAAALRHAGVSQAWACSFDALLHKDVASVNQRLVTDCRDSGEGRLLPVGAVNPMLPDWEEDVRRCAEVHRMPGIRLYPNYHGYTLDDARSVELLSLCDRHRLFVQVAVSMEDERTQHPMLRVAPVDVRPLLRQLPKFPRLPIVLLNALRGARLDDLEQVVAAGRVYLDIATQEGVEGIRKLLRQIPLDRILFGSGFPFFYLEAAVLKLRESALAGVELAAITQGNAERLIKERTS